MDITLGLILTMLIVGLIAGFLARAIVPGDDSMGIVPTIILGIVGSFVGGFLGNLIFGNDGGSSAIEPAHIIGSVIGAIIVLLVYKAVTSKSGGRAHSR